MYAIGSLYKANKETIDGQQKTVDAHNTANHIPRYTAEGHLLLPSGIEIW